MAKFKIIVSEPSTGKSQVVELEGSRAAPLIGRKLGETIAGTVLGIAGKQLQITGGSDKDGFPMRKDVHGGVRAQIIVAQGVGFSPLEKGQRRRKMLRGSTITEEIVQINMKMVGEPKEEKKKTEAAAEEEESKSEAETTEEGSKAS